jgi:hypothetical protein
MRASNTHLLLFAGCVAAAAYGLWPSIRGYLAPSWHDLGPLRTNMHLDPDAPPGQVEDRRGEHGGGDLGRLGPPPQWDQGRSMPSQPWDEARGEDAERPDTPGGRGVGCRDSIEHHPVDMSFCNRDRTGNADGLPRDRHGPPSRRWRYCTNSPGHVRHCSPWQSGSAREGE